jgi:hypothetical protein
MSTSPSCLLCKATIADHEHIVFVPFWVDGEEATYITHERCAEAHPLRRALETGSPS